MTYYETDMGGLHQGDVLEVLGQMPEQSVQCCVTSPPYYGLRDYGMDGQIGLESTPELFVERMAEVFRKVRRVLRDDGTLWLNLGDSYNGCKPKDLMMMPARVALALQADGWWIRSDIAWCKKTPMPESVTDRPTSAWEHIFLLSKSKSYYYDSEAVKVTKEQDPKNAGVDGTANDTPWNNNPNGHMGTSSTGANMRNFWVLGPEQFPDAHFATFPTEIPRRAIKAGTRVGDTVLDPFMGSGTTAQVAQNLNRRWVGIELNPEYCDIAVKRIQNRAAQRMLV